MGRSKSKPVQRTPTTYGGSSNNSGSNSMKVTPRQPPRPPSKIREGTEVKAHRNLLVDFDNTNIVARKNNNSDIVNIPPRKKLKRSNNNTNDSACSCKFRCGYISTPSAVTKHEKNCLYSSANINKDDAISSIEILNNMIEKGTLKRRRFSNNIHNNRKLFQQPKELSCVLRSYQTDAVKWAIEREKEPFHSYEQQHKNDSVNSTNEDLDNFLKHMQTVRGGILADEMGLGKTIETISLVLLNKAPLKDDNTQCITPPSFERISYMKSENYNWLHTMECVCGIQIEDETKETDICTLCGIKVHIDCHGGKSLWKRSNNQCLTCVSKSEQKLDCGATLIVCPNAIVSQWEEEIKRHTFVSNEEGDNNNNNSSKLRIYTYYGVQEESSNYEKEQRIQQRETPMPPQPTQMDISSTNTNNIIHPLQFENYDVILTTYNVLRKELSHANIIRRGSRFKKKYPPMPSPLVSINWWRICLDEAQMVESSTAKAAQMALKLPTRYRWGISGTPFVKGSGLDDLYGLLLFLSGDTVRRSWYKHMIQTPCEKGNVKIIEYFQNDLLNKIMWRSAKQDVQQEINVPPQNEITYRLNFNKTERHFYNLQKAECHQVANKIIQETADLSKRIDENAIHKIAIPLLRLRQACCHPQVGSYGLTPLHAKTPMPMDKILSLLITKAKDDCNKKLKDQVLYMSGLAAIANIEKTPILAMQKYTEILRFIDNEEQLYKIDKFQRLHCLHNLQLSAEKYLNLSSSNANEAKSLLANILYKPINELKRAANNLRNQEEAVQANRVGAMKFQLDNVTKNVLNNDRIAHDMRQVEGSASTATGSNARVPRRSPWYQRALDKIYAVNRSKTNFIASFRAILSSADETNIILWQAPSTAIGMGQVIGTQLDKLQDARRDIINYLRSHVGIPSREEVRERGNCRKCSSQFNRTGKVCFHCHAEDALFKYNRLIFSYRITSGNRDDNSTNVNNVSYRQESVLLKVLRKIGALAKCFMKKEVALNLESFDYLKQECTTAQDLHNAISQRLAYLDELDTCTNCLCLRTPGEIVSQEDAGWRILEQQVPVMKEEDEMHLIAAKAELSKARSQLKYLMNVQDENSDNLKKTATANNNNKSKQNKSNVHLVIDDNTESNNGCSICLGTSNATARVILSCAHIYCYQCIKRLIGERKTGNLKCSVCRQTSLIENIENIDDKATLKNDEGSDKITPNNGTGNSSSSNGSENNAANTNGINNVSKKTAIVGSYGTKIENIVKCAINILEENPEEKILIFSKWEEVLDITEQAFVKNHISNVRLGTGKKLTKSLLKFKNDPYISCLFLPLKSGANGLNLTEATHVILVEPILSKSVEAQAVGRVHRIGQTKETYVHRFVIEDTIEERIDALQKQKKRSEPKKTRKGKKTDANLLTGKELQLLFE